MIAMIKRHRRLNGLRFGTSEFANIALDVGLFAVFHLIAQKTTMAFITSGITVNCLPLVVIAVQMSRDRTGQGKPGPSIWNKQARPRHLRENPHMLRDNTTSARAVLIPFLVFAMVLYGLAVFPDGRGQWLWYIPLERGGPLPGRLFLNRPGAPNATSWRERTETDGAVILVRYERENLAILMLSIM